MMGLFDLPAPLFAWLDARLGAALPAEVRIILWGIVAGIVSMLIYRLLSPQQRIAEAKRDIADIRAQLDAHDEDWQSAWQLIRRLLGASWRQVGRVGWPAVAASLPLLALLAWMSNAFAYRYPDAENPKIGVVPSQMEAVWVEHGRFGVADGQQPHIVVYNPQGRVVLEHELSAPVPLVHKRQWWNALLGNPAGYVPARSAVEQIRVALPRREYIPVGPDWLRGWEAAFLGPLLLASILLKWLARIE